MSITDIEDWTPEDEPFDEEDYVAWDDNDEEAWPILSLADDYDDDFEFDDDFYESQDWEPTDA